MKEKGFTLVELLATIVIMGIIATIAIASSVAISNSIRNTQRDNVIKRIEVAAAKYAFDRGDTIIFVQDLIDDGYLEVSADNDEVIDPTNNKRLNCYPVTMSKTGKFYVATFIDDDSYGTNECNRDKLYNAYLNMAIKVYERGVEVSNDVLSNNTIWLYGNIELRAVSNDITFNCSNNACKWNNVSGTTTLSIPKDNIKREERYTFSYEYLDEYGIKKTSRQSITLRIDNTDANPRKP